jgi:tetratricopeptide (TPR) repeat protein
MRADQENARAAWDWAVERGQVARLDQAVEGLGWYYVRSGRIQEEQRRLLEQSLALYRALGDRWGMARLVGYLSLLAWDGGNYGEAQQLAEESLALRRALGDQLGMAAALYLLGTIASAQGQLEEAERSLREAIAIHQEIGDRGAGSVEVLTSLGWILRLRGKYAEAHALCREALALCEDTGQQRLLGRILADLGAAKLHQGQYEAARTQAQKSLTPAREVGRKSEIGRAFRLLGSVALAEEAYAEARGWFQESLAVYREIPEIWERGELSWALAVAACAARGLGDLRQARAHLDEALRTAPDNGFVELMYALPAVALLLAYQGEVERAVELYALASRYPYVANSRWFEDVAGKHIAAVAATLPPEVVAAAQERGRARDLWDTAAKLVAELGGR